MPYSGASEILLWSFQLVVISQEMFLSNGSVTWYSEPVFAVGQKYVAASLVNNPEAYFAESLD
jgi:hypothetical protein